MGRSIRRDALKIILFFTSILFFALGFIVGISSFEEYLLFKSSSCISINLVGIFTTIFYRNLIVGLMISILGIFTAGISSAIILFWNGLIVGKLFNVPDSDLWEVTKHFIFHGGFELAAFFLFGSIGLRGVIVFKELFITEKISPSLKLSAKEFILPVILLLISATIESVLIIYV